MSMEKREGLRLLTGLEEGRLSSADAFNIADKLDPLLIYFVLRFLREKYPASNPSSEGVVRRILELTSTYDKIVAKAKQGEKDVLREWFDETYSCGEFYEQQEEFISMLVDKMEG